MQIICPHCSFSREVAPDRLPDRPVRVTCPQCGQGFGFDKATLVALQPAAAEQVTCPACGLSQPPGEACSGCGVVYARLQASRDARGVTDSAWTGLAVAAPTAEVQSAETLSKAGFWIRVLSATLDSTLLLLIAGIMIIGMGMLARIPFDLQDPSFQMFANIANLFCIVLTASYQVFFVGYCGQTPGKMALRIKIIRTDNTEISYGRAFLREIIGKYISQILLCIGYLMVAFDRQKQGLHDKIADTYVVKL